MDTYKPGLEGIVAAETRLSSVDGQLGELIIAGFPLEELAPNATFEETVYLLWHDRLPTPEELTSFQQALTVRRTLDTATLDLLRAAAAQRISIMDALVMGAGSLRIGLDEDSAVQTGMRLIAAFPTLIAAYWRLCEGQTPISPNKELSHTANFLYMLTGEQPSPARTRALETYLNTVVDHGLNASTFTARVIISTGSDLISAIVGALGALKGPLHGGAPGPALDMVFEIGSPENAESYLRAKLERGERLMGFGHRVYKVRDPRADVLADAAEHFFASGEQADLYKLARAVEQTALSLLEEYKPGRKLQTNVEFYTALLLHGLGLSTDLFTPCFAMGRVGGWTAHAFEQEAIGKLIRPQSRYIGDHARKWPIPSLSS